MDRLTQLRGEAGGSRDSTLNASLSPSEAYITANDSGSSKFFSLSEGDSTFDISSIKDVSLASSVDPGKSTTETQDLICNLSPVLKKTDLLDSYKIGKQIEAANILSGGVNIFDDNDNSYDGDELVIDDNALVLDDKGNRELKESESELQFQKADDISEGACLENEAIASKDTEVVLQIDGKNVNAIDIGNGLYLYRKEGEEELAAVQIVDDDQQHSSFKFLKVRENAEGNLEVYEEIEIEVPKEVPTKEGKTAEKNTSHVPLKDINKVISDKNCSKVIERKNTIPLVESSPAVSANLETIPETSQVLVSDAKSDNIKNSKMMKYNETKKSPFIHSTPNKEGVPLTKVMVNQQLHPNRHSDNVKTIEVHTDSIKQKGDGKNNKNKELPETADTVVGEKEKTIEKCIDMSGNENMEATMNKNEKKQDSSTSDAIEHKTSASKEISPVVDPFIVKCAESNEKTILKGNDTNDTLKIENDTETISIQYSSENKDHPLKIHNKAHQKSDADTNKITINESSNANNKEEKSNEITDDKIIEPIDTLIENNKPDKILIPVDKDSACDLFTEKKESVVAKSESKINVTSGQETKQNEEHLEKRDIGFIKPVDSKKITVEDVSHASNLKKSDTGKSDFNTTDKNPKVPSIKLKENNDTIAKELTKDIKYPGNEDQILLQPDRDIDKISRNDKQYKMDAAYKPGQSPKNFNFTYTDQSLRESALKKEKLDGDNISADTKDNFECEKDTDLVCAGHNEKNKVIIVQTSTDTTNVEPNRQEPSLEGVSTDESHSNEKSNHETLNKASLIVNPVLASAQVKLVEVEKKGIVAAESIPATFEISSIKLNTTDQIEKKNSYTKIDESIKIQHIPIKPVVNNELNDKMDVTQEKTEDKSPKKYPAKSENMASSSAPTSQNIPEIKKNETKEKSFDNKSNNNNSSAVPFGKWTEANRQEFLNKIKESKVPSSSSNTNQIKQPNDLNRRDVLQKIDSQRQISSAAGKIDLAAANKLTVKNETKKFTVKPIAKPDSKVPVKTEARVVNSLSTDSQKRPKQEIPPKHLNMPNTTFSVSSSPKTESATTRTGIYNQDLIDRTIEDIINRAIPGSQQDGQKNSIDKEVKNISKPKDFPYSRSYQSSEPQSKSSPLDVIEMKMNELHGIPFVERPLHELPKVFNKDIKTYTKQEKQKSPGNTVSKIPNLVPFSSVNQAKVSQAKLIDFDSEEEIIEHEPITGDIGLKKVNNTTKSVANKVPTTHDHMTLAKIDNSNKETIIITENEFDKFARRNSITYENCLTVNFEDREKPNVVQTVKEKDALIKSLQTEQTLPKTKNKVLPKQLILHQNKHSDKIQLTSKLMEVHEDLHNKNYPSKLQMAYQSALTAKRHTESPITIIEDRPVKVVYMDVQTGFPPSQIHVQGTDLSPVKKQTAEVEITTATSCDSVDSDMLETNIDVKYQDKSKIKHQRKQVLTPVDIPEFELIEPSDLGVEHSPKKKRKTDDIKSDKSSKGVVPKKSYLLGRSVADNSFPSQDVVKSHLDEPVDQNNTLLTHNATASAIDNLVKAAELLETQSENLNSSVISVGPYSQQSTPAKRGRGRPRKYPLPDGTQDKDKTLTPQKKPRLIDAKKTKVDTVSDEDDSSDEEIVQENWTMGKINENILCPICKKLFRSENVVFKHVKHCTGPSPNRSEADKRSPRRLSRQSQESDSKSSQDSKSDDVDYEPGKITAKKESPIKQNCKELLECNVHKHQVIVIEDSPALEKTEIDNPKQHESRKRTNKSKLPLKVTNLGCDTCGKTFRQLSYLVNHKLQHEKDDPNLRTETIQTVQKSVFICEICKKEFRKLHHMVQHRLIHNPSSVLSRSSRKSSSEQNIAKDQNAFKETDQSAAFRCEPCDKSFRKLHHLVEHRETHDGINRQKGSSSTSVAIAKSPPPPPECDICKKRFRKLHHLIEHKEQHQETCSEKSDDRSVRSALSTKDIIHECSLCYMVFPNEHSLNKHYIICQRKKRQLATKQNKAVEKLIEHGTSTQKLDTFEQNEFEFKQNPVEEKCELKAEEVSKGPPESYDSKEAEKVEEVVKITNENKIVDKRLSRETDLKLSETKRLSAKRHSVKSIESNLKATDVTETPKYRKSEGEKIKAEVIIIEDTPKKKTIIKDNVALTITKRKKKEHLPISFIDEEASIAASSDDDEVRYMLNPNFKKINTAEVKLFMKVTSMKRNSLQLEKPNSKNVGGTSLQQPYKISRQKPKSVESRVSSTVNIDPSLSKTTKPTKLEPSPSTDSDDSDVKYSFPETARRYDNVASQEMAHVTKTPKIKRKSLAEKRKSLGGLSKRKSLGKLILPKLKAQTKPSQGDPKIRRRQEVDYRCDCGQLFLSAALLARHATLAHTPPRIRRRRSPPPEQITQPPKSVPKMSTSTDKPSTTTNSRRSSVRIETGVNTKPTKSDSRKSSVRSETGVNTKPTKSDSRKSSVRSETGVNTKPTKSDSRKSSVRSETGVNTKPTKSDSRKSSVRSETGVNTKPTKSDSSKSSVRSEAGVNIKPKKSLETINEAQTPGRKRKATVEAMKSTATKLKRTPAHKGVPVPEKMKKLVDKLRK